MRLDAGTIEDMFDERIHELAATVARLDDDAHIDLLRTLEDLKSACAAAQARIAARLDAARESDRGLAAEIALARRESPHRGGRHLGFARALREMPYTLRLLEAGILNEWRATLIVRETACLTREHRTVVDHALCADPTLLDHLGDRAIAAKARECAARLDAQALVERAHRAVGDRHVSVRPAPDGMAYLTALLPLPDGVGVYATLRRDADTLVGAGQAGGRTRAQVMADLFVQRTRDTAAEAVTVNVPSVEALCNHTDAPAAIPGHGTLFAATTPAANVLAAQPVTVNVVISDEALFGDTDTPAHIPGHGDIPAAIARHWIVRAIRDDVAELRRVYADPGTGALTATESRARCFPKGLARFIDLRDRTCRTPWCDAPIRHHDHIVSHETGGPTTEFNGAGLCERCNHSKQAAGWTATPLPADRHTYQLGTPTDHTYRSTAPPMPTPVRLRPPRLSIDIVWLDAA